MEEMNTVLAGAALVISVGALIVSVARLRAAERAADAADRSATAASRALDLARRPWISVYPGKQHDPVERPRWFIGLDATNTGNVPANITSVVCEADGEAEKVFVKPIFLLPGESRYFGYLPSEWHDKAVTLRATYSDGAHEESYEHTVTVDLAGLQGHGERGGRDAAMGDQRPVEEAKLRKLAIRYLEERVGDTNS